MIFSEVTSRRLGAIDDLNVCVGLGGEYVYDILESHMSRVAGEVCSEVSGSVGNEFRVVTFGYQGSYRTAIFFNERVGQSTSLKQHSKLVLDLPIEGNGEAALGIHHATIKYLEAA